MTNQAILSAGPSDMPVDMSRVDRMTATIQRRHTIWTRGKSVALAAFGIGAGVGLACFGASFLIQPKIIKVPELIEVPTVYETTKVVEKPIIVEKQVVVHDAPSKPLEAPPAPKVDPAPKAPPPPPVPAPTTETHPWDKLADKQYVGIVTDVVDGAVCVDHDTQPHHCIQNVEVDEHGHAKLDADGNNVPATDVDLSPMVKWIGYSVYKANKPADPKHLADYWVADHGTLIKFESAPKGKADVIMLKSDGQSLLLDVGLGAQLGEKVHSFILDTGASSMTVTPGVAAELVRTAHAQPGGSETVTYADGKPRSVQSITIDTVRVGTHFVRDVHATVTLANAPMLLGLDVLNAIGRFEVDAPHRTLTFNGAAS
jgi:clan AA aspartic protease (TIGR02281 family)